MLANWTKATTTTTGTGTITLAAVTGFPLPSAVFATGDFVQYSIVTSDAKYESGIGKIAATNTLERTKIFSTYDGSSYNKLTASALSLASGTHDVFITPMAENIFEPLKFPLSGPTNANSVSTDLNTSQANISLGTAQREYACPFRLEVSGLITAFGINVALAGAGSSVHLALYQPESNGRPGRRICKTSAAIDTTGTGYKTQTVSANVRVTPGWYWIGWVVVGGTSPQLTGCSDPNVSAMGNSGKDSIVNIRCDTAGATDMSDPFPTTSLAYTAGNEDRPYIGLLIS